ncbi:hypothetical protein CXB51_027286 [Gossypium anomalum]|uniref:AAA+ ATPase domain-containing protein n=1 Tax=Gossypium anomalum TaxID=47600 RepID=A0A8J6CTZ8_9ROSI|nr:hypothetical protein CXB51_027286 [Gossypium anomalum]
MFYDAKFGRKRLAEPQDDQAADTLVSNGTDSNVTSNGNHSVKNTSEMAIYEQYRKQDANGVHSNGAVSNGFDSRPYDSPVLQKMTILMFPFLLSRQKSLLPAFETAEMRALGESLSRDIVRGNPDVKWESIKGLESAKRLLKEAVVMPIKYPKYFTGLLSPWKGILLFGPPGTGKTMLAKAVATECKTTFFNISASSVVSKWRGDSEKLIKVLFDLARHHAPSTIFLDEIDAIISQRGGEGRSEHEASRRLKTELLIQMDGLTRSDELVFVLAATNLPWELDAAMLRRLEKRVSFDTSSHAIDKAVAFNHIKKPILVPLPEPEARRAMFEELLPEQHAEKALPYDTLVERSEGYSGSDIRLVCKEAAMQPLRRLMTVLESSLEQLPDNELPKVGPITPDDIEIALKNTRPSAHLHAHRYEKFNTDYGSQILG